MKKPENLKNGATTKGGIRMNKKERMKMMDKCIMHIENQYKLIEDALNIIGAYLHKYKFQKYMLSKEVKEE